MTESKSLSDVSDQELENLFRQVMRTKSTIPEQMAQKILEEVNRRAQLKKVAPHKEDEVPVELTELTEIGETDTEIEFQQLLKLGQKVLGAMFDQFNQIADTFIRYNDDYDEGRKTMEQIFVALALQQIVLSSGNQVMHANVSIVDLLRRFPDGFAVSPTGHVFQITKTYTTLQEIADAYPDPPENGGYMIAHIPHKKSGDEIFGDVNGETG